jgi:hypothetical protein
MIRRLLAALAAGLPLLRARARRGRARLTRRW